MDNNERHDHFLNSEQPVREAGQQPAEQQPAEQQPNAEGALPSGALAPADLPISSDSPAASTLPVNPAVWEEIAPEPVGVTLTPASVKVAGILAIVHGVLLVLNAIHAGRALDDMSLVAKATIWLGVNILFAGAIFDRQAWAWWALTVCGGLVGIAHLLKAIGFFVFQASGFSEPNPAFSPVLVGLAGAAMLLAVLLLLMPAAKAAFGMTRENPSGLLKY